MGIIRKNHCVSFKAKIALEAVKKEKTISQLSSEYGVHPNQPVAQTSFRGTTWYFPQKRKKR